MNDSNVRRWTGACGEAAGDLLLVASPLYVVMGTPPSLGNEALFAAYVTRSNTIAITTKLVDVVYLVGYIVFAAGLRHLIRRVRPDDEWLAAMVFGSALVQTASVLVFDAPPRRGRPGHVHQARPQRGQSPHRGLPRHDCFQLPPDGALLGGGELRHSGHTSAAEVDWLVGCGHRHPQLGRGSRDLWGERLHGSRGCGSDRLRLVCVHQRREGARLHWVAHRRRHLDDAREAEGRGTSVARTRTAEGWMKKGYVHG